MIVLIIRHIKRKKPANRLKSTKNLKVYSREGIKIGKVKEIYLSGSKIHSWLIKLDKKISKELKKKNILLKHKHVYSIKEIMILDKKSSKFLEELENKKEI